MRCCARGRDFSRSDPNDRRGNFARGTFRSKPRVHRLRNKRMDRRGRSQDHIHREGPSPGERLCGKLRWQAARRIAQWRDLLPGGGASPGRSTTTRPGRTPRWPIAHRHPSSCSASRNGSHAKSYMQVRHPHVILSPGRARKRSETPRRTVKRCASRRRLADCNRMRATGSSTAFSHAMWRRSASV